MKFCRIWGQNTHKLSWKLKKKEKPYSSFYNYSQPLLLNVTAFKYNKGDYSKMCFQHCQTTSKSVFEGHGKVLTELNVGSSAILQFGFILYKALCPMYIRPIFFIAIYAK